MKRRVLDRPGKKHLVIFEDREGNMDHMWLTTEEQRRMELHIRLGRLE